MGTYAYIARDSSGNRQSGTIAAASEQAVLSELFGRNLAPIRVDAVREAITFRRAVSTRQLATAYGQLADLLKVGMPLLKSLQLLSRGKSNPRLAAVMAEIAEEVSEGARLADTMGAHPEMFPPIQVAMIRAGERGGFLEQVFERLGVFLEKQSEMRARVVGNMIYPVMLLAVGAIIVVAALVFFVPKFQTFYARIELPLPTKILMASSAVLTRYWLGLIVGGVVAFLAGSWILRRPDVRQAVARWQLRIPGFGPLVASLAIARFTRILGTLLVNGVPMIAAMQISREAIGHPLLARLFQELRRGTLGGKCGRCEYRAICGGCRARAYGSSGDYLAEDSSCSYEPEEDRPLVESRAVSYGVAVEEKLRWSAEAQARIQRIPSFVRGVVVKRMEDYARREGHTEVTADLMREVRRSMPLDFSKRLPFFSRDD